MEQSNLPPLPEPDVHDPQSCETMRLYMSVVRDLPPGQQRRVLVHIQKCQDCARHYRLLDEVTRLLSTMEVTAPSRRVDEAVRQSIAARSRMPAQQSKRGAVSTLPVPRQARRGWLRPVALAATVLLALLTGLYGSVHLWPASNPAAFALPANLSWNGYVLYDTRTVHAAGGTVYQVRTYYNLEDDVANVETVQGTTLDVDVVQTKDQTLGMDMMHHVAQWGATKWGTDDSIFNLDSLRQGLRAGTDIYLGEGKYEGQDVYRILCSNGQVLLLSMDYMPVNVINMSIGPNYDKPIYDTLRMLSSSQVPSSMWDMTVPEGFSMGNLPAKP